MASGRLESIDFWRGVALAIIFVNHIPGNLIGYLTPRNYGFSDAAEAFVFIAGFSVVLAYGRRFRSGDPGAGAVAIGMRIVRLYAVHLFLTALALGLFLAATRLSGHDEILVEGGRSLPFADPVRGIVGIILLGHQIGYFDILPLYMVLLGLAPFLILLALRDRWAMLIVSAAIYGLARWTGANLPTWPEPGSWYFNPLAWQFLFALGVFAGVTHRDGGFRYHPWLYRACIGFTLFSAAVVSNMAGLWPGLVEEAGQHLDWGKTELGLVRLIDFLTLAYVLYCSNLATRLRSTALFSAASLLGRQALLVFCLGSLLSALGQVLNQVYGGSPAFDVLYVAAGLWVLYKAADTSEKWQARHHTAPAA
jgi:hypothetical protein